MNLQKRAREPPPPSPPRLTHKKRIGTLIYVCRGRKANYIGRGSVSLDATRELQGVIVKDMTHKRTVKLCQSSVCSASHLYSILVAIIVLVGFMHVILKDSQN